MPTAKIEVGSYVASVHSSGIALMGEITLNRTNGARFASLRFYGPEFPSWTNAADTGFPTSGSTTLYFPFDEFASVVDLLRNEKPVFLQWLNNPRSPMYGSVTTDPETPGEGE